MRGAVVLCYPAGNEYYYSHQAIRQLATRLARSGFHALRFDYYATGDSAGDESQASVEQWKNSIQTAIEETKKLARCDSVVLAGLRLGASLSWQTFQSQADVSRIVLWEPIVHGAAQIKEWEIQLQSHYQAHGYPGLEKLTETMGIELPGPLVSGIQSMNLSVDSANDRDVLVIVNRSNPEVERFVDRIRPAAKLVNFENLNDSIVWQENDLESVVPMATLNAIIEWLAK